LEIKLKEIKISLLLLKLTKTRTIIMNLLKDILHKANNPTKEENEQFKKLLKKYAKRKRNQKK
jgi:hypothetical protein